MATILGLILVFALGIGLGAWATYDWLRYHGMLTTAQQRAELWTQQAVNQILEDHRMTAQANVTVLPKTYRTSPNGDEVA